MPYINNADRLDIQGPLKLRYAKTAGELNFSFTDEIKHYIATKGECYQTYNDIIGALEGCKLELYRRKIALYEDIKIKENGDVF